MKKRILVLSFLFCICFSMNAHAADPVLVDCPIDTWTKVATNTSKVEIVPILKTRYLYTLRDTGGPSPANNDDSLLLQPIGVSISARPAVDIYIKTQRVAGTVRVAVFSDTVIVSGIVSVTDSALPSGAATSANQDTAISTIGDKLDTVNTNITSSNAKLDDIRIAGEKIDDLRGALKSQDTDEFISRISNSAGAEIDPATSGNQATTNTNITSSNIKLQAIRTSQTDANQKTQIVDGSGNVVGTLNNALNVHDADSHFQALSIHAKLSTGNSETFSSIGASSGDSFIEVESAGGPTFGTGDAVCITEGAIAESDLTRIVTVSGDTLTLDRPLENDYTTAGVITIYDADLSNINGTITTPVIYEIAPPSDEIWHITAISFIFVDGVEPAIELFSGIAALTNGLVVRQQNGKIINHFALRTNGDLYEYFGGTEVDIQQKSGGGDFQISVLWHLEEHTSAIIKLDGSTGDSLQFIGQDNLTAITEIEIICQGHKELE